MNPQVARYFQTGLEFAEVHFVKEGALPFPAEERPDLPRGWLELTRLSAEDRVEFTKATWLHLLPFHPIFSRAVEEFFHQLDDIYIVLYKKEKEEPWEAEMIYSLSDGSTFFRGRIPTEEEIPFPYPRDFAQFYQIHDGFGRLSEMGLLMAGDLLEERRRLYERCQRLDLAIREGGKMIDPGSLYPFYEVPLGAGWQCFYSDWYPGSEMGNVYLSGIDDTISDRKEWSDQKAFATFLEWLAFYLEGNSIEE